MKFKKPSEQKVKDTIALTGGLVGGSMLSKAVFGFIHEPTTATDAASIKKDENTALLKRGGLAAAGIAGALFIDGNDTVSTLVKGVSAGVAVVQILEGVRILASRNGVESEATAAGAGKKALARAVGLGCACNQPALNAVVDWAPSYDLSRMDYVPSGQAQLNAGLGGGWGNVDLKASA